MERFEGRTYLITGAARGIGAATARRLAAEGAAIALADLDCKGLKDLQQELGDRKTPVLARVLDTRKSEHIEGFVAEIEHTLGPLWGAVPCAGIARAQPAEFMRDDDWTAVIDVNLTGVFYVCRAVGRVMLTHGRGAIVNIASITSLGGQPGRANYAASKWGLVGLTKTLATEWGRRGLRVNAVAPNGVDTPMIRDGIPEDFLNHVMLDRTPLGRLAQAHEIAAAAAFLLSDDAAYVNGAVLEVDGGLTAGFLTHRHGADFAMKSGSANSGENA
ncbi:SDR family NAD(P)-dependent oxidoreductase [Microvirga rosea]|uniref:SDR family NAD(P)-dependent oxidoreductase n=1 Tax=Microvirga rosea TaxID=2715425 RepID=UPI001D0BDF76|nr:3-oxoacyl-ACP reductase FabG [Microvirga rosea]MCB8821092.1 3-oxoacyl-ACP reductase FabG [Microvirga rosea]